MQDTQAGPPINAYSMDELLRQFVKPGQVIDLMKIDVEGAEADIFSTDARWLDRVRNLVIELHSPFSPCEFLHRVRIFSTHLRPCYSKDAGSHHLLFLTCDPG